MDPRTDQVTSALEEARAAARAVGIAVDTRPLKVDDDRPKASYAFELEEDFDAPDAAAMEEAL